MSKILVVEDDELLREFLRIKLTTQGYRVDTASDGMAAYQSLRRQRPDLILLDMMLPVMSGGELLARLHTNPVYKLIPVIVLSLRGDSDDVIAALRGGAADYMAKPFDPEELVIRIERHLTVAAALKSTRHKRLAGVAAALVAVPGASQAAPPSAPSVDPLQAAIALHNQGLHAQAAASLRRFIALAPNDADLWLRLGLELSHINDLDGAEKALAKAVALAPDYADARDALARVRRWRAQAQEVAPTYSLNPADSAKQSNPLLDGEKSWSASLVHSYSHFNGGVSPDWNTTTGVIDYSFYRRENYLLQVDSSKTFGQRDLQVTGQAERHFSPSSSAYVGASIGDKARIKPQWSLRAGGETGLCKAVKLGIDTQIAHYATATVTSATPHVSYTLPHDRATITLGWINLWDEHGADRNGWSARADVNVTQKLMLFGGGANYPDTEAGITYRFSSRFLGGNYTISRKVTLMFGYETERNQLGVRRNGGWLGLRWALSAHSR